MALSNRFFLGFDPGGKSGFGAAMLVGRDVTATTVSTVSEAVRWAVGQCCASVPVAAGVDTLLHWCDGPSGWRPADRWLRKTYPKSALSVASANSLFGAMAVGGMALALRLRERWPPILLNETHPKVLIPALGRERYADADPEAALAWFADHAGLDVSGVRGGHQLDAVLSARATREGLAAGWADLIGDDPALLFPAGRVRYLWPKEAAEDQTGEKQAQEPSRRGAATAERRKSRNTKAIGYVNEHQQEVMGRTGRQGNGRGQRFCFIRCQTCGYECGANGSDFRLRGCPAHDCGAAGSHRLIHKPIRSIEAYYSKYPLSWCQRVAVCFYA